MNDMRKLMNIVESTMVKEQNRKGPPQQGTREYRQMHHALRDLGYLRQDVADHYQRWPKYDADDMLEVLVHIQRELQGPMQILDRMETDELGWEFRVQNTSWSILVHGDRNDFQKIISSEQVGPERIRSKLAAMDRDLTNLVNKLYPFANAQQFIDQ